MRNGCQQRHSDGHEGPVIVVVGLTSSVVKGGNQNKNFFFLKIAYILENNNFYLQLIHKLDQDMEKITV